MNQGIAIVNNRMRQGTDRRHKKKVGKPYQQTTIWLYSQSGKGAKLSQNDPRDSIKIVTEVYNASTRCSGRFEKPPLVHPHYLAIET